MRKRIIAIILCLALCVCLLPRSADALTNEQYRQHEKIMKQIQNMYQKILLSTELESTNGLCGLLVSWELYFLKINNLVVSLDGNQFFDYYKEKKETDGGFPVRAYPASDYTLEEALYTITNGGTEDVYNLMVGFQWTNTDAGKKYGHVCMIHAIINGYVYFVEGFEIFGVPEGQAAIMDITSFADYWADWTEYEGTIYFGKKPADYCDYYGADLYFQTMAPLPILEAPDMNAAQIRKAAGGERLHATGIYKNESGSLFYQIDEGGVYSYIPAGGTEPILMNYEDLRTVALKLPKKLTPGKNQKVTGKIQVPRLQLEGVWLNITDADGKIVTDKTVEKNGKFCNLGREETLDLSGLPEGSYTYNIHADLRNYYVSGGDLTFEAKTVALASQPFTVGDAEPLPQQEQTPDEETISGWSLKDGTWYYYEDGQPRTGWICAGGVNYYLKEDGSVTTGWAEVNGIQRYFTDTGALRVGWMENGKQTYYLLRNGDRATGWRTVEGGRYYLGDDGVLRKKGWLQQDDKLYYLDENGKACVGWVDLREGRFSFHADGYLLARMVGDEIVEYDGTWKPYRLLK